MRPIHEYLALPAIVKLQAQHGTQQVLETDMACLGINTEIQDCLMSIGDW